MEGIFIKDPSAVLDYGFDWSDWLETRDTISSSSWAVTCNDEASPVLAVDSDTQSSEITKVWLSSGTPGKTYVVTNTIHSTNSPARIEQRSFEVYVTDR